MAVATDGRSPLYSSTQWEERLKDRGRGSHFLYWDDYWNLSWLCHSLLTTVEAISSSKGEWPFSLLTNCSGTVTAWRAVDFLLIGGQHHTNHSDLPFESPLFCLLQMTLTTGMRNAQEGHKPTHPTVLWESNKVAQFKSRFSEFISNFLPCVVPSWRPHSAWDLFLFLFHFLSLKNMKGRFQSVGCYFRNQSDSERATQLSHVS